jgi:hypothetical protein
LSRDTTKIRLDLARGHWALAEHEEALTSLERLADAEPAAEGLAGLVDQLLAEAEAGGGVDREVARRLAALRRELPRSGTVVPPDGSPLATETLARLLADQGHAGPAVAVAQQVLRARPDSPGARRIVEGASGGAIDRLERWLERIRRHASGEARA